MTFGQPLWFWAFALFPVLLALFLNNERQRGKLIRKLVAARLAERLAGSVSPTKRRGQFALLLLGTACVIVSLAQPRWGYTWQEQKTRGRDVIIAVDVSRSMLANDLAPSRLVRAKLAAEDLISQLGGDRVGVIAFAGSAFLQAPLTADHGAALAALHELDPEIIPRGGTNIAEAIRIAVEAFGKGEGENRAMVIFTDGEELDADGIKAAKAQSEVARIFTVGVGSSEGTVIAVPSARGDTDYVKDSRGQIVKSRLDEEHLRAIAEATGGFYLHLQNGPAEMRQLAREGIASMSSKEINADFARQPIERYQWPLGAGMALLCLSMFIGERRRGVATRAVARSSASVAAAGLLLFAADGRAASPAALYEEGRFEEAQRAYENLLKANPTSDRLAFNHGAAAYKNRDFKAALESFGKALTSTDTKLREKAEYNLGNTLFQQGVADAKKGPDLKTLESALTHFDQARKLDPQDPDAQHNYDATQQLIEKLKQQPPEQKPQKDKKQDKDKDKKQDKDKDKDKDQKQDKDQKDQQGGKDQKDQKQEGGKDDQKQDQQSGSDQKDQQQPKDGKQDQQSDKGEGKDQKDEQQKDGQSGQKDQRDQQQSSKDGQSEQEGKEGEQPDPSQMNQQKPKPQGELKDNPTPGEESKESQEQKEAAEEALAAAEGRMTEAQAKALLDSLKSEDRNVRLWDSQDRRQRERPIRDW